MQIKLLTKITLAALAAIQFSFPVLAVESVAKDDLKEVTEAWPNRPKLALFQMVAKYGLPQEATYNTVIWHNAGPFKRITVNSVETSHNFPKPHPDFLQHTLAMKVPADKANDLVAFDGSNTFSRTEGEISARCDSEAHNVLTLNLIYDLLNGTKTVAQAREAFSQNVTDDLSGKNPEYMQMLVFDPTKISGRDPDQVTVPGASQPMTASTATADAEVLCMVAAVDESEILAAEEVEKRKVAPEVLSYAKSMRQEHGKNIDMVMKLGAKIGTPPTETNKTDQFRIKSAGSLAMLVQLDGDDFGKAYIKAMVKDHAEVLELIDNDLMKSAQNAEVKQFLTETRTHVQMHLDKAKSL